MAEQIDLRAIEHLFLAISERHPTPGATSTICLSALVVTDDMARALTGAVKACLPCAYILGAWFARHGPVQHDIHIVTPLDGPAHIEPRIERRRV